MGINDLSASVANVSGFTIGEVVIAKKVSGTGFNTEYMRVHSSSRLSTDDNNQSGLLFVTRSFSGSTIAATGSEGFRGEAFGQSSSYEPGQVLVSTGVSGSGYIRLNANPRDLATPYIDIIERTGSGIYDTELKARLGDLSGLSRNVVGTSTPGFGLFSENVFLTGTISASAGAIGGISMDSGSLFVGAGTHGNANTAFFMDSGGKFSLKDKLVWNGSALTIAGSITITNPGDIDISDLNNDSGFTDDTAADAAKILADTATGSAATADGKAVTAQAAIDLMETRVVIDNTGMALKAKNDGSSGTLNGQTIAEYGTTTTFFDGVASADANKKLEMNASGITLFGSQTGNDFLNLESNSIVIKANNLKKFEATDAGVFVYGLAENDYVNVKSDGVDVVAAGTDVASFGAITRLGAVANNHMSMSSDGLSIKTAADVTVLSASADGITMSGSITAGAGEIGGMTIDEDSIFTGTKDTAGFASNNGDLTVGTSGIHSKVFFVNTSDGSAGFAGTVTIGGTDLTDSNTLNTNTTLGNVGLSLADISGSISGSYLNSASSSMAARVKIESTGISIDNASGTSLASLTNTLRVGRSATNESALRVDASGNITIGTSNTTNMTISANGSIEMSGEITAAAGAIGGWVINTAHLQGGPVKLDKTGAIEVTGSTTVAGTAKDTIARLSGSAPEGSTMVLNREGMASGDVDIVKLTTSQSYDDPTAYTTNVDKKAMVMTFADGNNTGGNAKATGSRGVSGSYGAASWVALYFQSRC